MQRIFSGARALGGAAVVAGVAIEFFIYDGTEDCCIPFLVFFRLMFGAVLLHDSGSNDVLVSTYSRRGQPCSHLRQDSRCAIESCW